MSYDLIIQEIEEKGKEMYTCYLICVDGIEGYDQWFCDVAEENDGAAITEKEMLDDVRQALEELGGGHADIIDNDNETLVWEIEI